MGQQLQKSPIVGRDIESNDILMVFATIFGTTWRMFAPVLLGLGIGYFYDTQFKTRYGMAFGVIAGCIVAVLLIARQYKQAVALREKNR